MSKVQILDHTTVQRKITRMAFEIWERNAEKKELLILGIKKGGFELAELLKKELSKIADLTLSLESISMDKKDILSPIEISNESKLKFKNVLIVDDVANTGKTLLHAIAPVLKYNPDKIELAVLVNRKHKLYPIKPDVVGTEIATTLQENIEVNFNQNKKIDVYMV